ncbi:MAG: hypothetical protein HC884_10650 [Chloroflexaceae bacterium]|nr:hypothetical protein [Chloroflexaceae bacterium]
MDDDMIGSPFLEPDDELAQMAQETIESQVGGSDIESVRRRCERVLALYEQGAIKDSRDNFHAALVLLYGERPRHYELSRLLSHRAAKMGEMRAWTLEAMAWDRWLLSVGKPQHFGTQIIREGGRWSLGNIEERTTDTERAMYGVPPLYVQRQRAQQLQRQEERDG